MLFLNVSTLKIWIIIILPTDQPEIILSNARTTKNCCLCLTEYAKNGA